MRNLMSYIRLENLSFVTRICRQPPLPYLLNSGDHDTNTSKCPPTARKSPSTPDFSLNVPGPSRSSRYIEGDGTGLDITPVMLKVVDAAVEKAYGGKRKISWMEIYAGEKSTQGLRPGRVAAGRDRCRR